MCVQLLIASIVILGALEVWVGWQGKQSESQPAAQSGTASRHSSAPRPSPYPHSGTEHEHCSEQCSEGARASLPAPASARDLSQVGWVH